MDFDRSLSDTANQPSIATPATPAVIEGNVHYLTAAPVTDVMYEQLEYLIGHSGGNCLPDCIDCGRLQQVRNWLLLPFRSGSWSKRCFADSVCVPYGFLLTALIGEKANPPDVCHGILKDSSSEGESEEGPKGQVAIIL
jgi:hypothetical protein